MSGTYPPDREIHENASGSEAEGKTEAENESAPTGESDIEALYRQVRQASRTSGHMVQPLPGSGPDTRGFHEHLPGILVCALRTPTLPPATHTNCYLVGAGELVVVDPSSPHPEEQAALDRVVDALAAQGRRVVEIWLTHHHLDHVSGAAHLARRLGVPVAAHARTAALVRARVRVDRLLADGDTRDLAGDPPRRLRAVHTPGHAPGHLCFLEERSGALVAGDMVAGVGTILVEPSEGNMRHYMASLQRMKALAPTALLPAHGPTIADAAARLDAYIHHRSWREARVVDALRALGPAALDQLVPAVYADVVPAIYPLAERSLLAHLLALAEDGRAHRDGDRWRLPS